MSNHDDDDNGYRFTVASSQRVQFRGHSDDTFCAYLDKGGGIDHDDCAGFSMRTWRVTAPGGDGLHVSGCYGVGAGVWMVGISQLDEDVPLPDWPMQWMANGYSMVLCLTVPAGTVVELAEVDGERFTNE